jgi:hypothetical protein
VAGLDLAGEAVDPAGQAGHDATVLTIARILPAPDALADAAIEVVRHYAWTGATHTSLYGALISLLKETWRVERLAVDATGIGEPAASFLARALGSGRVEAVKLTAERKSALGFGLISAVNGGRLRLYDSEEHEPLRGECLRQLERCRAVYRANRSLGFYVDAADGHDDYVISLALTVAAATRDLGPRRARGRTGPDTGDTL